MGQSQYEVAFWVFLTPGHVIDDFTRQSMDNISDFRVPTYVLLSQESAYIECNLCLMIRKLL